MHLSQLTLKGFKSFADPVTLDLEPGVNVVVGPNGSGKSNIVDAVAWVLGSQAPKSIRTQKMDDVIFAGTADRPALGRAEVSLTIDNSDGQIPVGFTEVVITRTLFRSGESEYKLNGAPVRLLDIQELLSDSGVGRSQHVIASQGNLDMVLNARPEDRRSIIEEAAGVLKHRRRREKALRRIDATEADLLRAQDLVREVRRQIGPLRRQADAARRYDSVVAELLALRRHLAGRELSGLKHRLATGTDQKADLDRAETEVRTALAALDTEVITAEETVSGVAAFAGAEALSSSLTRAEALRERARGLAGLVTERRRSLDQARRAHEDESVAASLEAEASRLQGELEEVEVAAVGLEPQRTEAEAATSALEAERQRFEVEWGEGQLPITPTSDTDTDTAPVLTAAEVRGELSFRRQAAERTAAQASRVDARLATLSARADRLSAELRDLRSEANDAETDGGRLDVVLAEASAATKALEEALSTAERSRADAEAHRHRCAARAEALAQALDEARARAGAERLAHVSGVVGTILDLVEVDSGWEAAFEAACGEAVAAVVVDGPDAARRALGHLEGITDHGGAVLPLPDVGAPAHAVPSLPGVESVRAHVRTRLPGLGPLLDRLLASAVCVPGSWGEALDLHMGRPDLVVVTRRGDRFSTGGWRIGAGGGAATQAAVEEAVAAVETATAAADIEVIEFERAKMLFAEARRAEADAQEGRQQAITRRAAAEASLVRVEAEHRDVDAEAESLRGDAAEFAQRSDREAARIDELTSVLPDLEAEEQRGHERNLARRAARRRLDEQADAVAGVIRDLEVRVAAIAERRVFLEQRLADTEERLARLSAQRTQVEARRLALDAEERRLTTHAETTAAAVLTLEQLVSALRGRRQAQADLTRAATQRLDGLRRERHAAERRLAEVHERQQRAEVADAEVRLRIETAVEAIRRDLDCTPDEAMATVRPELAERVTPDARVRELERDVRLMGPVNPLAIEELAAVEERAAFLDKELDDIKSARRELAKVVRVIDAEIVQVSAAAYADVADAFQSLFGQLFPGGQGRLRLTTPDDPLNTGIEIEARPSGKNVKSLALLSGGERSLVALCFLFAVFKSRPSPFYLLDEVEAALDDVNLNRFITLMDEFRRESQLLIVSHQKRTMDAADCLYGVSMRPGGSSKVVSERLRAGT